jgi:hypothetical protein
MGYQCAEVSWEIYEKDTGSWTETRSNIWTAGQPSRRLPSRPGVKSWAAQKSSFKED